MTDKDPTQDPSDATMPVPIAPGAIGAAAELIKAAGKDPNAKDARAELGKAAHTIAKTINVALLPLAAINFGYERARAYFENRFEADLQQKLKDVPPEEIVEPKPSLAGPVMQGLAFSHDEDALRDMYLQLLASAMNGKTATTAHPSFVEIIKQLTAEEAQMLCGAMAGPEKEIVQIRFNQALQLGGGWSVLLNHMMSMRNIVTGEISEVPRLPAMIDNWIRLGLVDVSYEQQLKSQPGTDRYAWAQERPEFKRLEAETLAKQQSAKTPEEQSMVGGAVAIRRGVFRITAFGGEFYRAVRMDKVLAEIITQASKEAAQQTNASPPKGAGESPA